jgi:hypothetical protein
MQARTLKYDDRFDATLARDVVVLVSLPLFLVNSRCGMPA